MSDRALGCSSELQVRCLVIHPRCSSGVLRIVVALVAAILPLPPALSDQFDHNMRPSLRVLCPLLALLMMMRQLKIYGASSYSTVPKQVHYYGF